MNQHTANYYDTLIVVSEDTNARASALPPHKGERKSIAEHQYELLATRPYQLTSDDVLWLVYASRTGLSVTSETEKAAFFSKGLACLRTSPLVKNYGFGIHCNSKGKVALIEMESKAYQTLLADGNIKKVNGMRRTRK